MSALNVSSHIRTLLLGDSLIQGLSRYTKALKSFRGWIIKLRYTGRQSRKFIMASGKTRISTRYQTVIHCGTNNIEENTPNDIANGLLCSALTIKKKVTNVTNVYLTGLLPRDFRDTHMRNKIKKVNELIREKCSSTSIPPIIYIEQDHDWIDEGNCLRTKYYYRDCLHLVEIGNKKLSNTII